MESERTIRRKEPIVKVTGQFRIKETEDLIKTRPQANIMFKAYAVKKYF